MKINFSKTLVYICVLITFFLPFSEKDTNAAVKKSIPKVSVIIPVYKVEKYIRECLNSVVNQTLKDIEIICVDDGSPDKCPQILDEYAKKDKRIKVIHQKNKGLPMARQAGIDIAKGEYIKHVDSDDYLDLKACEICYNEAKKDDVDILVHGGYRFSDKGKQTWRKFDNKLITNQQFQYSSCTVWTHLYKNSFIRKNGINYKGVASKTEDECFNMLCYPAAKKIKTIKNMLYYYRRDNVNALTKTVKGKRCAQEHFTNIEVAYKHWDKKGYFKKQAAKNSFLKWALYVNLWSDNHEINKMFTEVLPKELLDKKTIRSLPKKELEKFHKIFKTV